MTVALDKKNNNSNQIAIIFNIYFYLKYNFELGSIREELERSTSEARDLYSYVVATNTGSASVPAHTANISHSEIMSEVKAEIHKLREEVKSNIF